jgi:type IV secretion system protein VirD4
MNLVHFVVDEAAALGHLEVIDDMLSAGRGFGERVHLFFQNSAQLMKCYPDGQHQFVMGTTTNIFFAAHDALTCEEISKRCGNETVTVESGGENEGWSFQGSNSTAPASYGTSGGSNRNWSFVGKPLIRPEEVAALPERLAITFAPGVGAPIATWLTRYFEAAGEPSDLVQLWHGFNKLSRAAALLFVCVLFAGCVATVSFEPTVPVPSDSAPRNSPAKLFGPGVQSSYPPTKENPWRVNESGTSSKRSPTTSTTSSGTGRGRTAPQN